MRRQLSQPSLMRHDRHDAGEMLARRSPPPPARRSPRGVDPRRRARGTGQGEDGGQECDGAERVDQRGAQGARQRRCGVAGRVGNARVAEVALSR